MAYKVNYGFERAERNRLKQEKKEAKLRERKASADQTTLEAVPTEQLESPQSTDGED